MKIMEMPDCISGLTTPIFGEDTLIQLVSEILSKCNSNETNISPTLLYNEGWMVRLLVSASIQEGIHLQDIDFSKVRNWYSEGLISTPFLPTERSDKLGEGYTHADMVIGDFEVKPSERGDITIKGDNGLFGVIEAKMRSKLSAGTKNAPGYNQASRNLACIAYITRDTEHNIFFSVAAPDVKIKEHSIKEQVSLPKMLKRIEARFNQYDKDSSVYQHIDKVLKRAKTCKCSVISYESWLDALTHHSAHSSLVEFKDRCYKFNKIALKKG